MLRGAGGWLSASKTSLNPGFEAMHSLKRAPLPAFRTRKTAGACKMESKAAPMRGLSLEECASRRAANRGLQAVVQSKRSLGGTAFQRMRC